MRLKCQRCGDRYTRPGGVGLCEVCLYAESMGDEKAREQTAAAEAERAALKASKKGAKRK